MGPEPQKFHVGLIDLFSVWLPGALLTYVTQPDVLRLIKGLADIPQRGSVESWAAFLFISYLLGHFIFVLGSFFLDRIDTRIRTAGHDGWTSVVQPDAKSKKKSSREELVEEWKERQAGPLKRIGDRISSGMSPVLRWIGGFFFDEKDWGALDAARNLKRKYLSGIGAETAVNAFQWSKSRLALQNPDALAIVQRSEADSKFFRSLCIVLVILIGWGIAWDRPSVSLVAGALLPAAFWRFLDLRVAATSQAYWFIITLETTPAAQESAPAVRQR